MHGLGHYCAYHPASYMDIPSSQRTKNTEQEDHRVGFYHQYHLFHCSLGVWYVLCVRRSRRKTISKGISQTPRQAVHFNDGRPHRWRFLADILHHAEHLYLVGRAMWMVFRIPPCMFHDTRYLALNFARESAVTWNDSRTTCTIQEDQEENGINVHLQACNTYG